MQAESNAAFPAHMAEIFHRIGAAYAQRMASDFNEEVLLTIGNWLAEHGLTGKKP